MKKNTGNLGSCSSKNLGGVLKFVIPSLLGVFLFMTPISIGGEITIPVAVLSKWVQSTFADVLPMVLLLLVMITAVGTLVTKIFSPKFIIKNDFLNTLFNVTPVWFVIRMLATVFIVIALYEVGFAPIYSGDTGGLVLYDLLPILFSVFLFAGLFLPLLLNFGLLEFIGTLLSKIMRPVFNLPGRSAIDCIASWLGDGTIGVLLTSKQYEDGFYTKREAAVIGTTGLIVAQNRVGFVLLGGIVAFLGNRYLFTIREKEAHTYLMDLYEKYKHYLLGNEKYPHTVIVEAYHALEMAGDDNKYREWLNVSFDALTNPIQ